MQSCDGTKSAVRDEAVALERHHARVDAERMCLAVRGKRLPRPVSRRDIALEASDDLVHLRIDDAAAQRKPRRVLPDVSVLLGTRTAVEQQLQLGRHRKGLRFRAAADGRAVQPETPAGEIVRARRAVRIQRRLVDAVAVRHVGAPAAHHQSRTRRSRHRRVVEQEVGEHPNVVADLQMAAREHRPALERRLRLPGRELGAQLAIAGVLLDDRVAVLVDVGAAETRRSGARLREHRAVPVLVKRRVRQHRARRQRVGEHRVKRGLVRAIRRRLGIDAGRHEEARGRATRIRIVPAVDVEAALALPDVVARRIVDAEHDVAVAVGEVRAEQRRDREFLPATLDRVAPLRAEIDAFEVALQEEVHDPRHRVGTVDGRRTAADRLDARDRGRGDRISSTDAS